MAQLLSLRDNATEGDLTSADVVGEVLWTSAEQSHNYANNTYLGAEVTIKYDNLVATNGVTIQAIIEGKDTAGVWSPTGYQFNPMYTTEAGEIFHKVVLDPQIFWTDAGVANIVYVGYRTIGEISPQQVTLPTTWRVKLQLFAPEGYTFTSVSVDVSAELVHKEV